MINFDTISSIIKDAHSKFKSKSEALSAVIANIKAEYKLKYIGEGVTRIVFKVDKNNVLKIDHYGFNQFLASHNKAEYCFYKAIEGTKFSNIFAKVHSISDDGFSLIQEYLPRDLPYFEGDSCFGFELIKKYLKDSLLCLKNLSKGHDPLFDFHEDNIRLDRDYNAKIIDYSPLLVRYMLAKNVGIDKCIKKVKKYTKYMERDIEFFLSSDKRLVLKDKDRVIRA